MVLIKCRITQDYCYNNDYGNCYNCDVVKNNTTYLKPCPFCGGEASILIKDWDNRADEYKIACSLCGVTQKNYAFEKSDAIAAWNRRVDEE